MYCPNCGLNNPDNALNCSDCGASLGAQAPGVSLLGAAAFGIGPVAIGIWALVEGIMILTGKINTDANGVALI